jgi:hypothetical protein
MPLLGAQQTLHAGTKAFNERVELPIGANTKYADYLQSQPQLIRNTASWP